MTHIRPQFLLVLLLIIGALGVASTYMRLSETDDELFHLACGMEWWEQGTYHLQPLHPPLARAVDAALPYALDKGDVHSAARDVYMDRMLLSRLGVLPFYILSCLLVFGWSRKLFGMQAALCSLALYITLSTVTAHAGLATTDMVYTSMLLWALMASMTWLEHPGGKNSVWLGAALGCMLGSKFSTLVQWPFAMWFMMMGQMFAKRPLISIRALHIKSAMLLVLPVMIGVIAMIYRFSFAPLWQGIQDAAQLNQHGFGVWFYGPLNDRSDWRFFPVVFFFKTPLPFMALALLGTMRATDIKKVFPALAALGIMLVSMTSHINLGVRHVLPVYPLLAIPAGYGLHYLWQAGGIKRAAALAALLWQIAGFANAYPEHLAYFNVLAGAHPEHISNDSDYDWGQNILLLSDVLAQNHVDKIYLCARKDAVINATVLLNATLRECPVSQVAGWVAVSRAYRIQHPNNFAWLAAPEAVQKVGRTMDLYYFAPK